MFAGLALRFALGRAIMFAGLALRFALGGAIMFARWRCASRWVEQSCSRVGAAPTDFPPLAMSRLI
jgi:hypothetical protein